MILTLPIRLPDWETRLHDYFESRRNVPFSWGTNDCCSFAADAVLAMTGVDIFESYRGRYDSQETCLEEITRKGHTSIEDAIRHEMKTWGLTPVQPTYAHRGDLILTSQEGQPALCVVSHNGKHSYGVSESGLVRLRTYHDGIQAWRVPYEVKNG